MVPQRARQPERAHPGRSAPDDGPRSSSDHPFISDTGVDGSAGTGGAGTAGTGGAGGSKDGGQEASAGTGGAGGSGAKDSGTNDAPSESASDAPPDTTAPTIVSITPADATTKVSSDTPVVITFSEPMDQAATQAAVSITTVIQNVPTVVAGTSASWDMTGTVLTVSAPFAYATAEVGNDFDPSLPEAGVQAVPAAITSLVALSFTATVAVGAKDLAGNPLAAAKTSTFSTKRRVIQHFVRDTSLCGNQANNAGNFSFIEVGDTTGNLEERAFITFDLNALPNNLDTLTKAQITSFVWVLDGTPEADNGPIDLESTSFTTKTEGWSSVTISDIGAVFTTAAPAVVNAVTQFDVTTAAKADYDLRQSRGNRSQYRLKQPGFMTPTDSAADDVRLYHRDGTDSAMNVSLALTAANKLGHANNDFAAWPVLTLDYFLQ